MTRWLFPVVGPFEQLDDYSLSLYANGMESA